MRQSSRTAGAAAQYVPTKGMAPNTAAKARNEKNIMAIWCYKNCTEPGWTDTNLPAGRKTMLIPNTVCVSQVYTP